MNTQYSIGGYRTDEESVFCRPSRVIQPQALRRGVLQGHGAGGRGWSSIAGANSESPRVFVDAGYPYISADIGNPITYNGMTFGNDDSSTALTALWAWAKSACGFMGDKFCWYAGSMGGQTLLNWAIQGTNATQVQAAVLVVPALDVDDAYINNTGGLRAAIGTAYGVSWPTDAHITDYTTHSPIQYSDSDKAKITFPLKIWASDNDFYTTTSEAQAWAASVNTQTGLNNVEVVSMGEIGHAFNRPFQEPVAWMDAHGGRG